MELEGYPPYVILLILGVGVPLVFWRPYAGFLFAVLLLTAGHLQMFNKTRLVGLGPYLNLTDICLLLAVMAFYCDCVAGRRLIRVPQIVALMLSVVLIAGIQSAWRFGWTHETQAALRGAMDFPLAVFLGANLVDSADRARKLVTVLLAGSLLAAIQHVAYVSHIWLTKSLSIETYASMRTIAYWAGCLPSAFLLAALLWKLPQGLIKKGLWLFAGILFLATIFLNQTRSLWLAMLATLPVLMLVLGPRRWVALATRLVIGGTIILLALAFLCQRLAPGLDVGAMVTGRLASLLEQDADVRATGSRERAFRAEMASWGQGTLVFGRGLSFFQGFGNSKDETKKIAFAHLGYVTYLSQLGILGLLVYGGMLPLVTLRSGLRLWRYGSAPAVRFLGGLGAASIICVSIMFAMSSQFLGLVYTSTGVLYGGLWTLARSESPATDGALPTVPGEAALSPRG